MYWANYGAPGISFANLDGTGGGDLSTAGATASGPRGAALDAAGGRVYWVNESAPTISFANLDGSGGDNLATPGAPISGPSGIAVDPAAGRIYWANGGTDSIAYARVDGTGGGTLATAGATLSHPAGVAVDPGGGRIYWANLTGNEISFARLDGSGGGGDVNTAGATVSGPEGVALDPAAGRIYWANQGATERISFAGLDGSGGGDLNTTGATVNNPTGVAVDAAAGRIYWVNFSGAVSFANLDGSGGGDLNTTGATLDSSAYPALLKAPSVAGVPQIQGGRLPGSVLGCSNGAWAPDLVSSFVSRAPRSFAFQWSVGGADIAGATAGSYTAFAPGDYRCRVVGSNIAGSASQTSGAHTVASVATFGARTLVSMRLAARRIPARGPLRVRVGNANPFAITGTLAGRTVNRVIVSVKRRVKLRPRRFAVGAGSRVTVRLALPRALRRELMRRGALKLRLTARVTDPAGTTRTVSSRTSPRLKRRR